MRWEAEQRGFGRGKFVVVCQHERWSRTTHRPVLFAGNGIVADEVGPTIPCSLANLEKQVWYITDGTTAAVVGSLVDSDQAPIR